MNLAHVGKVEQRNPTVIPDDDLLIPLRLRGKAQAMVFEDGPNIGQPKGVAQVLKERGLWDHYLQLATSF